MTNAAPLPRTVVALGLVSLFMDVASGMTHALMPVFMTVVLGAPVALVGLVEGVAQATAALARLFAGVVSDWIGRRKPLVLLGYGMSAATMPLFPTAQGIGAVMLARFLDRVGKGIRSAPRDALIADVTPAAQRGAAYGLRQAMDMTGAFLGPLAAIGLMLLFAGDSRAVLWFAVIPAAIAVALIAFGVKEPADAGPMQRRPFPLRRAELKKLPAAYWQVVGLVALFSLARFSEAFLLLRAAGAGLAPAWVPLVLVALTFVNAVAAYPLGKLGDRMDRRRLLGWGVALLVAADLVLAFAPSWPVVLAGAALWGLHMAMTQGLLSALIADAAPAELRGVAFGAFNLVQAGALLLASSLAGLLWSGFGPQATFLGGAGIALLAMIPLRRAMRTG
ncbi:MFS transporter [Roseomonas sp. 18066]|uniref:MFS transporter n=1 Tax=Roseomonas sp. 18066 TaxID=2681412 RepID=UPI001358C8A4|nr:MFS transporter [Roseomonas sp. 18066]